MDYTILAIPQEFTWVAYDPAISFLDINPRKKKSHETRWLHSETGGSIVHNGEAQKQLTCS